ncbi:MAG: hypothetical protein K6F56_08060 [Oscillospiraceae bacterium]|nr:hypothetical protein [Oscillospiraceae bacterium]
MESRKTYTAPEMEVTVFDVTDGTEEITQAQGYDTVLVSVRTEDQPVNVLAP